MIGIVLFVIGCGFATVYFGAEDVRKIPSLVLRSAIIATFWTGMAAALIALVGFVRLELADELSVPTWTLICWWLSVAIIMPSCILVFTKFIIIDLETKA